ncbi:hypothetical protein CHLNCDRAFT_27604 [Chlorella variabilis]|uniref:dolichyl-phosphate beta-glucosyltransferase n=1 Tax=Chlorella variabilis TaxID=554065 RepID=E1ZQS1_CHLVA|nr:hypothetical protein CHLNCDRAFT_27604 [Chlorella variabilis]EFN51845.1 hypothetical protein CHLNCDRAFT_27604 [Chlorella variabilis]|eukprot:XP_005843947.1 hypothetical protein CHLNCDRAFT_27604 [Chlorella variabilis]
MAKFTWAAFARLDADSQLKPFELEHRAPDGKPVPCPSIFSEPTKDLTVVIPAYNEEDRLPATLQETLSYLQRRRDRQGPYFTYEVIIVDDGSRDGTVQVAADFARKHGFDAVRVLRLPQNRGKGYAVKSGMLCSRGQRLLMMDADGATKVSDLECLEAKLAEISSERASALAGKTGTKYRCTGLGLVLGSRAHIQDSATAKRSALRNFLMHGFHVLVMMVVGNQIRDTQCGFKLFTRSAAQQLYSNQRLQRWCFDVELVYLAQRLKVPMAEVQVNWTEIPGSKIRLTSMVHMALELAMIKMGYGGEWARIACPSDAPTCCPDAIVSLHTRDKLCFMSTYPALLCSWIVAGAAEK